MSRYLVAQPENLKSLSLTKLAKWISLEAEKIIPCFSKLRKVDPNQAENLLSRQIQNIRTHLEHELLGKFHNELAVIVIAELVKLIQRSGSIKTNNTLITYFQISKMKIHVITRMIETIFTNKLTSLSFHGKMFDMFHESLNSESHLLSGLTCLELKVKFTKKETEIISLLQKLPKLRILTISNVCTNNILRCIAIHCKFIEELRIPVTNICDSLPDINDFSIKIIREMSTMRYIDINNTKVTKLGVIDLLLYFPKLERISITDDKCIYEAIDLILASYRVFEEYRKYFSLKSYVDTRVKFWFDIKRLVDCCPSIEEIYFKKVGYSRNCHLSPIGGLEYLRKLVLLGYDFYSDLVKELIDVIGRNLTYLDLKWVRELDLNALIYIFQNCPNLETLKLNFCNFISHSTENNQIKSKGTVTLAHLKKLIIGSTFENDAPKNEHLYFLLSNCPRIEYIDCCGIVYDPVMIDILNKCPSNLAHLKVLVTCNNVDMVLIDRIVQNCVNPPKVIERSPLI